MGCFRDNFFNNFLFNKLTRVNIFKNIAPKGGCFLEVFGKKYNIWHEKASFSLSFFILFIQKFVYFCRFSEFNSRDFCAMRKHT